MLIAILEPSDMEPSRLAGDARGGSAGVSMGSWLSSPPSSELPYMLAGGSLRGELAAEPFFWIGNKTYQYSQCTIFGGHFTSVLLYSGHHVCTMSFLSLHFNCRYKGS